MEYRIALNAALDELESKSHEKRVIIELRLEQGYTDEEVAEMLDLPLRTLQRRLSNARKWLFDRLSA